MSFRPKNGQTPATQPVHGVRPSLPLALIGAYLLIALSLSLTYAFNSYMVCQQGSSENVRTFTSFSDGFEAYKEFKREWRPRLFSNYLAQFFVFSKTDTYLFSRGVGAWNGFWFALCCMAYLLYKPSNWLFLVFASFGALSYGFVSVTGLRIYPWDMPATFFFVLLYPLVTNRQTILIILLAAIGMGFKETVALFSLVFLFWRDLSLSRRLSYAFLCLLGCVAVKVGIDLITSNSSLLFTQQARDIDGRLLIADNMRLLLTVHHFHPLLVNAGTFVLFLLLPAQRHDDWMWKTMALVFLAGLLVTGLINEYPIFFEMIPLSLVRLIRAWEEWTVPHDGKW